MKLVYWNQCSILCISVCACKSNLFISTLTHSLPPSQCTIIYSPTGFH